MNPIIQKSLEIEKQIISASLFDRYYILNTKPEYFLNGQTQKLFKLIQDATLKEESYLDTIVEHKLSKIYAECLDLNFFNTKPDAVIEQQKNLWLQYEAEKVVGHYSKIQFKEPQKQIAELWDSLVGIVNGHELERVEIDDVVELFEEEQKLYEEKKKNGDALIGYDTGFKNFNELADGLRQEHLIIAGGYTSMGKTFWSLNMVANLIKQEIPVAFYSLEMSKIDVFGRLVGILSGINSRKILKGFLTPEEIKKVEDAKILIKKAKLRVHTEKNQLQEIMMSMNTERITDKAKVFIIDYAQLITTPDASEYDTMRRLATELQAFCRKKKVPVILLSQVSNENAKSPETNIIGFKGSGALGASADIALELVPNDDKETRNEKISRGEPISVKMCVKKNRHGRIRNIIYSFDGSCGQFKEDELSTQLE